MSEEQVDIRAQLAAHSRRDDLARLVRTIALSAADERRARFSDGLDELLRDAELEPEDGVVGSFNVLRALSVSEPPSAIGRDVLGTLFARGLRVDLDERDTEPDDKAWLRIAEALCWLSANTHISAVWAMDDELTTEQAARLWEEMRGLVLRADELGAPNGRGEAMIATAGLQASEHAAAREGCEMLRDKLRDPSLRAALQVAVAQSPAEAAPAFDASSESSSDEPATEDDEPSEKKSIPPAPRVEHALSGEIVPNPLGPLGLVLWTVTGLIVVRYIFRFIANVLLRRRRPVEVTVANTGVTLNSKLELLGRTVRTRETHIPTANLARAVREVRYPSMALYAGLAALALGTYIGISLATDGARSGSPSLLALGAGVFGLGLLIDLLFSTLLPGKQGKHRVIFVPRKGRSFAVRTTDGAAADKALRALASTAA